MQSNSLTEAPSHRVATPDLVMLSARALAKSYGATRAVVDANLELRAGSIVGMVGENGSGKSTLVKLFSGVTRPDHGQMVIDGRSVSGFRNPAESSAAGIATVFQEILVAPARSVYENVVLGADGLLRHEEPQHTRRMRVAAVIRSLAGRDLDLDAPVEALGIAERQLITISRALIREPKVLILDESTSALDVTDRDRLFERCRKLRADGLALLFITHRLEELLALADEIVVIRNGETVTPPSSGVSREGILEAMTRTADDSTPSDAPVSRRLDARHGSSENLLRAEEVVLGAGTPIDFVLKAGSIVGLAGLEGHGQEGFLKVLSGARPPDKGRVLRLLDESEVTIDSLHKAASLGVVYLPRDRARAGILPALSAVDNFVLPTIGRSTRLGLLSVRSMMRRFDEMRETLHIHTTSGRTPISKLSGGNQQKVLIARWLAANPAVLLLDDPTRGVDLPTKAELHALMRRHAEAGLAVVLVSTELEELESVCDSVIVFHENSISRQLDRADVTRDAVLAAMFGGDT